MSKTKQINFAILDDCCVQYQKDVTITDDENFEKNSLEAIKDILKSTPKQRLGEDYVKIDYYIPLLIKIF